MNLRDRLLALLDLLPRRTFCGADGSPYLTRYTLLSLSKRGRLALHRFHRSDSDRELHSHPWGGVSLILRGGYREERRYGDRVVEHVLLPGSINTIRPDTYHRVDLLGYGSTWTLILTGPAVQSWGFWDRETREQTPWREFIARKGMVPA